MNKQPLAFTHPHGGSTQQPFLRTRPAAPAPILAALAILLIAALLRLNSIADGLSDVCLTVPEEQWLFAEQQTVGLYTWNIAPAGALSFLPGRVQSAPLVNSSTPIEARLFPRLAGVAAGLLTVALILRLRRGLNALSGLFLAVAPWLVQADRWVVQFDFAPLCLAVAVVALWRSRRARPGWPRSLAVAVHILAALLLLLVAPPLWWMTAILLLLQPYPNLRLTLFLLLAGVVLIPAMQAPELWLAAAARWDVAATAACVVALILLSLCCRLSLPDRYTPVFVAALLLLGAGVLVHDAGRKSPNNAERELVRWLQTRLPDGAVVEFDSATWPLAPVVACPVGAAIQFQAHSTRVEFFDVRTLAPPDYIVGTTPDAVAALPFALQIAGQFWVGRSLEVPNAADLAFGDLAYLLGYELLTPNSTPGGMVDVRLDYQFGANITPDALAYAAFLHITPPNIPETKWVNYTDPVFAESGNTGSRRVMLNHHIRVWLPPDIPPGAYDVRYGLYNIYDGQQVEQAVILGQIQVEGDNLP